MSEKDLKNLIDEYDEKGRDNYPDLEFNNCGDTEVTAIKRLPGTNKIAPKIAWGEVYKSWPLEKRLQSAERLADAMNHAADVAQQQVFDLVEVIKRQEKQLEQIQPQIVSTHELLQNQMNRHNAEKQELQVRIVELDKEVRDLKVRLDKFEDDSGAS